MASGHIKPNISLLHELFAAIFFTFCEQLFQQPEPAVPSPSHFVTSLTNQAKTCIQKFQIFFSLVELKTAARTFGFGT